MRICVTLTSAMEIGEHYREQTRLLAQRLAEAGHEVVFGGTDYGLMKVLADEYKDRGGKKLVGVFAEDLMAVTENYRKSPRLDQEYAERTILERKQRMMDFSEAFILFPGGWGTLEELAVIAAGKANHLFDKPIVAFSPNGFYDGLRTQLEHACQEKFSKIRPDDVIHFSESVDDCLSYIARYKPKKLPDKFL